MSNKNELEAIQLPRRRFIQGGLLGSSFVGSSVLGLSGCASTAKTSSYTLHPPQELRGEVFNLTIDYMPVNITGRERIATVVNGSLPAPTLRWKEGQRVTIRVTNRLPVVSSIHWHGLILPTEMDGVPGMSFDGIAPGETFEYQFDVQQSGTYWYHSHSGFQEQTGLYGAIVIEPRELDPVACDREHIVQLSDWSDEAPQDIFANLKKLSHYYNFQERTVADLWREVREQGLLATWRERRMWNEMRMSDRDVADVTGHTYSFLMNGHNAQQNWTGLFQRGERLRLRVINSAAMTFFDVRIPGLKMTVVAADGQNVQPVAVDEFRIAPAETYDVIVEPGEAQAYTLFAQSMDRSGYACGTLALNAGSKALIPAMDKMPVLGHRDMGMGSEGMGSEGENSEDKGGNMSGHHAMHHHHGHHGSSDAASVQHAPQEYGPQVDMRVDSPANGLRDPGIGLREHQERLGRRVLHYGDLRGLVPTRDKRAPSREIELHLTGNMSRYLWSINGVPFAEAEPLQLTHGERVRFTLVNDTMMTHPIHLHGLWSELETGDADFLPRKHTVIVQPGSKISYQVTADAKGRWAYHCHLLFHMSGMFREVRVV